MGPQKSLVKTIMCLFTIALVAACQPAPAAAPTPAVTVTPAAPTSTASVLLPTPSPLPSQTFTPSSLPPTGPAQPARGNSYVTGLSSDGALLSFTSTGSNLVSDDANDRTDAFVYLRLEDAVRRVSVSSAGQESGFASWAAGPPLLERYVYFKSESDDLVTESPQLKTTLFEHDLRTGNTRSLGFEDPGFEWPDVEPPVQPVNYFISSNRRIVLVDALTGTNQVSRVFLHDTATGQTRLLSRAPDGSPANGPSYAAALSFDGRYSYFFSWAGNLAPGDNAVCQSGGVPENCGDVFLYDRASGRLARISAGLTSGLGGAAYNLTISRNGRYSAFHSLNPQTGDYQITFYDRFTNRRETTCAVEGELCRGHSPVMSANGRLVLFSSGQVYLFNLDTSTVTLISAAPDGSPANGISGMVVHPEGYSGALALSADGRWAAYSSTADNLLPGLPSKTRCIEDPAYSFQQPENGCYDIFLYNVRTGETTWVTRPPAAE